jgi:hypothetical protein
MIHHKYHWFDSCTYTMNEEVSNEEKEMSISECAKALDGDNAVV